MNRCKRGKHINSVSNINFCLYNCFLIFAACPSGTYKNSSRPGDIKSCTPCPDENHMNEVAAISVDQCQCKKGFRKLGENRCACEYSFYYLFIENLMTSSLFYYRDIMVWSLFYYRNVMAWQCRSRWWQLSVCVHDDGMCALHSRLRCLRDWHTSLCGSCFYISYKAILYHTCSPRTAGWLFSGQPWIRHLSRRT